MARAVVRSAKVKAAVFPRISPLADVAVPGRFGADNGAVGVELSVRHPLSLVTVIARKGKSKAVASALEDLKGVAVLWAGPDQYFVQAEGRGEGELAGILGEHLAGIASISDQSHGRVVMCVSGQKARAVLAKGTPADLHPEVFAMGQSALTQIAHVGVHLTRVGRDAYDLSVFRGFSASFWEWLTEQAEEFGYTVR